MVQSMVAFFFAGALIGFLLALALLGNGFSDSAGPKVETKAWCSGDECIDYYIIHYAGGRISLPTGYFVAKPLLAASNFSK